MCHVGLDATIQQRVHHLERGKENEALFQGRRVQLPVRAQEWMGKAVGHAFAAEVIRYVVHALAAPLQLGVLGGGDVENQHVNRAVVLGKSGGDFHGEKKIRASNQLQPPVDG